MPEHFDNWYEDDGSVGLITLLVVALSGAFIGAIAGALGAVLAMTLYLR